ncbi:AVAST type 2 anti-phage system protein Avs2 [Hafnia alvei]|uniref:AVAST type 2 anti-phage system protein Avs2 n=1 Tax=Hafnia alvei TaxID=569 RepID=UPI00345D2D2C
MEPISLTTISIYVAKLIIDQFLAEEGYGYIRKKFFPKKEYADQLYIIIEETATEYEKIYPISSEKIPFYHSMPLFEILNKHILFKKLPSKSELLAKFAEYPNVIPPNQEQLERFYGIFLKKINECKILKKLHIEETYKEKIFDINDEIIKLNLILHSLDEKLTFQFDEDWLNSKNKKAIADLGGRYTPELNVRLEVSKIFDGIGRTQNFSKMCYYKFHNFLAKGKEIKNCKEISEQILLIGQSLAEVRQLYLEIDFTSLYIIPVDKFCEYISNCQKAILESKSKLREIINQSKINGQSIRSHEKYSLILRRLREFEYECESLCDFLKSVTVRLSNNPFLLLEGEAGIGKSHLLADVIKLRITAGYPSLFLLGQQLTTDESPWIQILKLLQIKNTSTDFLEKINLYGKKIGKRFLIIIDAINEGNGNRFWGDFINSFIDEIKSFDHIGLIMSVRSTYKDITISKEQIYRNGFETHKLSGFKNVEKEAVNLFYDYYNIEKPSSPNLNPEFKNPLFLKLMCEGLKRSGFTRVPAGFHGISKILSYYVCGVNKSLASPKKYNYDRKFPLVNDSLNELIKVKLANGGSNISFIDAHKVVQSVVKDYVSEKNFLNALIDEGLLTKGNIRNQDNSFEEVVYISFERFDDHLTVNYLLDGIENIESEFKTGGRLKKYLNEQYDFNRSQGIIEALAVQLPEKYEKEIYELLPELSEDYKLVNSFIDSLVWRDIAAIDFKKIETFINKNIVSKQSSLENYMEKLISISGVEGHPMNAIFLHEWLLKFSLADRDAFWTKNLKYKYDESSTFRQLIDWAWRDADIRYISDKSIELVAITLCWFLTSSNRELRDCSTKALVNLLEDRILVLIKVINKFEGVNDPYIWERVFAVALGCTLRTKNNNELSQLAEIVFDKVFKHEYVYPNILLRDYAREIIEYISHLGLMPEGYDLSKTRPPYKSIWPENIPSKDILKSLYYKDGYFSLWRSIMGGGDFSRYTIGTNFHHTDWSGCKLGETLVNRKEILKSFLRKLTNEQKELYNSIDPFLYDDYTDSSSIENILNIKKIKCRKSEGDISYNKKLFKNSLSEDLLTTFENDLEPYFDKNNKILETDEFFDLSIAERLIFKRVIELGWSPRKHGDFDKEIGSGRGRREFNQERIGKKYQWISYYEYMAMLSDNFIRFGGYGKERKVNSYQGPWDPYVRDIDPTILLKNTGLRQISQEEMWWANDKFFDCNCTFEEWMSTTISNPYGLIEVNDTNGDEWLVLESHPSWKEPDVISDTDLEYPIKEIWCQVRAYLVKSEEFEIFKSWSEKQNYMGRWMPESAEIYQLFNREFYWSEAFHFFQSEDYSCSNWTQVVDRASGKRVADVSVTSVNYVWGEEFDKSKNEALNFLKPSKLIFDKMGLKYSKEDGAYENKDGNIICFAAEALHATKPYLIIKKEPFLKMLKDNHLNIVWTLLGEKNVTGNGLSSNYNINQFSGSFYMDNDKVNGTSKIYSCQ